MHNGLFVRRPFCCSAECLFKDPPAHNRLGVERWSLFRVADFVFPTRARSLSQKDSTTWKLNFSWLFMEVDFEIVIRKLVVVLSSLSCCCLTSGILSSENNLLFDLPVCGGLWELALGVGKYCWEKPENLLSELYSLVQKKRVGYNC